MESPQVVLGVAGMLGSELFAVALGRGLDVFGTSRTDLPEEHFPASEFPRERISRFDALRDDAGELLDRLEPGTVYNCIGIVKSREAPEAEMLAVNGDFPKRLAKACAERGIRLIHVSTDCVFSGRKGNYSEEDAPDPTDAYGRTKLAGEVGAPHLTIRTSMIGRERGTSRGLLSWFLGTPEGSSVQGYTSAIWSGLTSGELARVLLRLAEGDAVGILHVAGEPISKHDLLVLFKERFEHGVTIIPNPDVRCDRSLAHRRLDALGIRVPPVEEMVRRL